MNNGFGKLCPISSRNEIIVSSDFKFNILVIQKPGGSYPPGSILCYLISGWLQLAIPFDLLPDDGQTVLPGARADVDAAFTEKTGRALIQYPGYW